MQKRLERLKAHFENPRVQRDSRNRATFSVSIPKVRCEEGYTERGTMETCGMCPLYGKDKNPKSATYGKYVSCEGVML